MAIDGDTIVAGAPGENFGDNTRLDEGAVYIFATTGPADRTETAQLISPSGNPFAIGARVAINGVTIFATSATGGNNVTHSFARSGPAVRGETGRVGYTGQISVDNELVLIAGRDEVWALPRAGAFSAPGLPNGTPTASAPEDHEIEDVVRDGETIIIGAPRANGNKGVVDILPLPKYLETSVVEGKRSVKQGKKLKVRFSATHPDARFDCQIDKSPHKICESPYTIKTKKLKRGKHKFYVAAAAADGQFDRTPSKFKFKVKRRR